MEPSMSKSARDLPPIGLAVKLTVGTIFLPENQTGQTPIGHTNPHLRFHTRYVMTHSLDGFSNFLNEELSVSTGLFMILIEDWFEWAARPLMAAIPGLPAKLVGEVNSGLGLSMLPIFEDSDQTREFCYVSDHIDIHQKSPEGYSIGSFRLGVWEARRRPIATWVKNAEVFTQHPDRPCIVIFGERSTDGLVGRIEKHYTSEGSRRWDRLSQCLPWIYLDLFYIFTNWDSTLEVARFNVEAKGQDMFSRRDIAPIVQQTRELHRDASTTLALQEGIRLQQASIKRFKRGLQNATGSPEMPALHIRMDYVLELLEFYETTCLTILEQQRNLLNLTFNLETVTQSRAVARLNALAIFFLPISFVASIFGITTLEASAYWYPVAAVPTLLLTAGIAYILSRSTEFHQDSNYNTGIGGAPRRPKLARLADLVLPRYYQERRHREPMIDIGPQLREFELPSSSPFPEPSQQTPSIGPAIMLNEEGGAGEEDHAAQPKSERLLAGSNVNLGFRVTGVARVSTGHLSPNQYANAAPGALRSPSGSLRHD